LLALLALNSGCVQKRYKVDEPDFSVVKMDSCEYIKWDNRHGFQHKGNCKFCAERRRQELNELIKQLKEK